MDGARRETFGSILRDQHEILDFDSTNAFAHENRFDDYGHVLLEYGIVFGVQFWRFGIMAPYTVADKARRVIRGTIEVLIQVVRLRDLDSNAGHI